MRVLGWLLSGLVVGLAALAPASADAFATQEKFTTSSKTEGGGTDNWYYFGGESVSVFCKSNGSADYDVYVDKSYDGSTWTKVASSLNGAGLADSVNYTAPESMYLRVRIVEYSDTSNQGARYSIGSDLVAGASVRTYLSTKTQLGPNGAPDSTVDVKLYINSDSGTTLWSKNAYGAGGIEAGWYTPACTGCYVRVGWSMLSGSGKMKVSFNNDRGTGTNKTGTHSSVSSTKANRIKNLLSKADNKDIINDATDDYERMDTAYGSGSSMSSSCGWSWTIPSVQTTYLKKVQTSGQKTTVSAKQTISFDCEGRLRAYAEVSKNWWFCITSTACICGVDVVATGFVQGDLSGTGDGSAVVGAQFDAGPHCGLHKWACGYIGGFVRVGYEMTYKSGVAGHNVFIQPGAQWHAKLATVGPEGGASYTKRYALPL